MMNIYNFKRSLCLLISIILLFSNMPAFCQEMGNMSSIISQEEIDELTALAKNITGRYNRTLKSIRGTFDYADYIAHGQSQIGFKNRYSNEEHISNAYRAYYKDINDLGESLQLFQNKMRATYTKYLDALPEGTYLKKITANYINERMNTLFSAQNYYLEKLLSIGDIVADYPEIEDIAPYLKSISFSSEKAKGKYLEDRYRQDSKIRNEFMKDLVDNQAYYQRAFSEDMDRLILQLKNTEGAFSEETIKFFSQQTHTADEILTYFAKRLPEEQKAVLFSLKVTDEGLTIKHLIPYVRYYLKQTNRRLWKLDRFSAERLTAAISRMSFAERADFMDDLLDFKPQTKLLRSEIRQTEKSVGKRIINRKSIQLSGVFMAISAFLVVETIMEIVANNNFAQSVGPVQLAEIRHKIDAGELLTFKEMTDYYTDERNSTEILENPLGLFEVFEMVIMVNNYLDQLNIEENTPLNYDVQQEQMNEVFDQYMNKFDWKKVTSEIGTL